MNQPDVASQARTTRLRLPADMPARLRPAGILIPFVVLFIVLSVASGPFFTKVNLLDILDQQASTLIIAAAGTLVLVAGGIDLSVGAIYALAGVTAAHLAQSLPAGGAPPARLPAGLPGGAAWGGRRPRGPGGQGQPTPTPPPAAPRPRRRRGRAHPHRTQRRHLHQSARDSDRR